MAVRMSSVPFWDSDGWSLSEVACDIVENHSDGRFFFEVIVVSDDATEGNPQQKGVYFIIHHLYARHDHALYVQCSKLQKALRDHGFGALPVSSAVLSTLFNRCRKSVWHGIAGQPAKGGSGYPAGKDTIIGSLVRSLPSGTAFSLLLTKNDASGPVKVTGMSSGPADTSLPAFKNALPRWGVSRFRHDYKDYVVMRLQAHGLRSAAIGSRTIGAGGLKRLLAMPMGPDAGLPLSDPSNCKEDVCLEMLEAKNGAHIASFRAGEDEHGLYFHTRQLERGTAILGAAGSGKTALIQNMMLGCHRAGMNVLCLDLEGTELRQAGRAIGADIYTMGGGVSPYLVNCFRIKGLSDEETKNVLKEVLLSTLDCPSPLDAYLADALEMMYGGAGTVHCQEEYKAFIARAFAEKYQYSSENTQNLRTASEVRLRLTNCLMGEPDDAFDVAALAGRNTFIEFRQMTSEHEKLFALAFILFTLITYVKKCHASGHAVRPVVMFIDELHILLDSQVCQKVKDYLVCLLKKIVHEGRKYNLWLCVADQSPRLLMPVIEAVQSKLVMRADSCLEELAAQLNRREAGLFLPRLRTGEVYVRAGDMAIGVFARTLPPARLTNFPDCQVREYMGRRGRLMAVRPCRKGNLNGNDAGIQLTACHPTDERDVLVEGLVNEVVDFAFTFVMEHPERLGEFADSFNLRVLMKAKEHEELTAEVSERLRRRYATRSVMHFLCRYY